MVSVTASSGLTARFEQMPSSHDGSTRFTFWLYFSKEIDISYNDFTGSVFQITGGTVKRSRRLAPPSNIGWEIPVGPGGDDNVVITLPGNRGLRRFRGDLHSRRRAALRPVYPPPEVDRLPSFSPGRPLRREPPRSLRALRYPSSSAWTGRRRPTCPYP